MEEHAVLTIAGIALLAFFCQWFAWWVKLPAILFLLLAGILAGPVSGLVHPDALFGELLFPIVSLSVAVILFEGSLTLRFSCWRVPACRRVSALLCSPVTVSSLRTMPLACRRRAPPAWRA